MNEIEKAIQDLGFYKAKLFNGIFGDRIYVFDMAIQSLQEKLEREKGCECCNFSSSDVGSSINNVGDDFILIKSDDGVSMATDGKHFSLLKIKFCPMCGRRLNNDVVNVNKIDYIGEATNMVEHIARVGEMVEGE